jgi:hypothetical protein
MSSTEPMPGRCGAKTRDGGYCMQPRIKDRCRLHSGKPVARARAEAAVVAEVTRWGLGDATVDPGEVLLRLVTQSAARVELYSRLLEEAYAAAGRLQATLTVEQLLDPEVREKSVGDDVVQMPEHAERQVARQDLVRIFSTGGVAALIGHQYSATKDGDVYAAGEAIRGLAKLEAEERDRCASFAAKAVAAGLAERQVRLAERQGQEMAGVFRRVLEALGLSDAQRALVPGLLAREISVITGQAKIIEAGVYIG